MFCKTTTAHRAPTTRRRCLVSCVCGAGFAMIAALLGCDGTAPPSLCAEIRLTEASVVEAFNTSADEQNLTQAEIDALLLAEIPVELQLVLDDRDRFTISENHPMRDVTPGTIRDDVDSLNGCWGRIETERQTNLDASDTVELVQAEAWRIDLRNEGGMTLDAQIMTGVFGLPCSVDDRPRVQSLAVSILEIDDSTVRLRATSGQSAGLDDDGSLSTHEVARAITYFATQEGEFRFTVEGDSLITTEEGYDPNDPSVEDVNLWIRFECVR